MSDLGVTNLLSVQQAIEILDRVPVVERIEQIGLVQAQGRSLAQDVLSDGDYPAFDKSLMDGFAVRRTDVASPPTTLKLVGEVAAGSAFMGTIDAGECVQIMTGAPMPAGADGVVPVELTQRTGDRVQILAAGKPDRYIARRGSDCAAETVVLRRGDVLGPAQLAVAATVGAATVSVFAPPRVALLSTGDEIVPFDASLGPNQIRNSNSIMLSSMLKNLGCEVTDLGHVPDDIAQIRAALQRGFAYDAFFITGGMSMGEYDFVPKLLIELGVQLQITKLKLKPGKPFVFGVHHGSGSNSGDVKSSNTNVFGLPGNPVSGYVCTHRLASRLIRRMQGQSPEPREIEGHLTQDLPANGPREFCQPVILEQGRVQPLKWKGSADVFTLAKANALLIRPENAPPLASGTIVSVQEI